MANGLDMDEAARRVGDCLSIAIGSSGEPPTKRFEQVLLFERSGDRRWFRFDDSYATWFRDSARILRL
jgi:hypothetical protein